MMDVERIGQDVDSWIAESELPVRATLKVESKFDDLFSEENLGYGEGYLWSLYREHGVIMSLPQPEKVEFWPPVEKDGDDTLSFAFGSSDFQSQVPEFNKYHYMLRKMCEKIFDLATTYAVISHWDGKINIFARYRALVDSLTSVKAIIKCEKIWREHAFER